MIVHRCITPPQATETPVCAACGGAVESSGCFCDSCRSAAQSYRSASMYVGDESLTEYLGLLDRIASGQTERETVRPGSAA